MPGGTRPPEDPSGGPPSPNPLLAVVFGAVYLLVGVLGLFLIDTGANIIALNGADNVLHFASAVLLPGVGLGADRATTTAGAATA